MTHTHTVTVTECGAESVISLSDTHTHTHCPFTVLPKVFVSRCHFLQQVGDVVRHIRHLGTLTAVTDAMKVTLRQSLKDTGATDLTRQHGEAGGDAES